MTWAFCTSGSAIAKAGTNANSTIVAAGSTLLQWCTEAEGDIVLETRRDWIATSGSVNAYVINALADAISSMVALKIISYDVTGYLSREADMLMNFNDDIVNKKIRALKDFKSNTIKAP